MTDQSNAPSFNLVDQPWIPCVGPDSRPVLLGLEETLSQARSIREIYDDSPVIAVTLHRLLLAILHRNFGPEDVEAWAEMWQGGQGQFDAETLHAYFHEPKRYSRFDLFDLDRPFYQSAKVPFVAANTDLRSDKGYEISAAKMAIELAAGNNDTLFDHSVDDRPRPFSADEAARLLVASQGYSMGGRITFERKEDGSADASPLVKGAVALVRGGNLFQTLMLNLHCYSAVQGEPFHFDIGSDTPAWDCNHEPLPVDRRLNGYLDLLTWQSRRIRLRPETDEQGGCCVRTVVIMKGEQFVDGFHRRGHETMVAFTRNEKATDKQDPWPAVGFREDRVLRRNSLALFESVVEQREQPKTLHWLHQLVREGILARSAVYPLDLFGISSDQAKILLWRHERLPLPLALLDDRNLLTKLRDALDYAEQINVLIRQSAWHFAKLLLLRDESKQPGTEQRKEIQKVVDVLGPDRLYWSSLEAPFHRFLNELSATAKSNDADSEKFIDQVLLRWCSTLRTVARQVFANTIAREDASARALKAAVTAERYFSSQLSQRFPVEAARPQDSTVAT